MLTNLMHISQPEYRSLLRFSIKTGGNLIVFGKAGVGKTEMAEQSVLAAGFRFKYVNISVLEAPDLIGLPVIDRSGARPSVTYAAPQFLPRADETEERFVILLDEIDKGKEEIQNPLLELLQKHSINGVPLAIHSIIATGNLPDENAFSKPVNHALTNRCLVYRLEMQSEAWLDWAKEAGLNFLVTGFISKNQDWLEKSATEGDPTDYTRPSPRSWTLAAHDLDAAMADKETDTIEFLTSVVAGRVGGPASIQFRVWLDHYRHIQPEIDRLVQTGKHPGEMSLDRLFVAVIAAMDAVRRTSQTKKKDESDQDHIRRVHQVCSYVCSWIGKQAKEFQIAALKTCITPEMLRSFKLVDVPEFVQISRLIHEALKTF